MKGVCDHLRAQGRLPWRLADNIWISDRQRRRRAYTRLALEKLENRMPLAVDLDAVEIVLTLTDSDGAPVTSISAEQDFVLRVSVQDVRAEPRGVFAAFLDITWDSSLAVMAGEIQHGDPFINVRHGDISTPGLIDEAGAVAAYSELGAGQHELFSVPLKATSAGELVFAANATEQLPMHDVLVYASDEPVPQDQVHYGSASIVVTEESVALDSAPAAVSVDTAETPGTSVEHAAEPASDPSEPSTDINLLLLGVSDESLAPETGNLTNPSSSAASLSARGATGGSLAASTDDTRFAVTASTAGIGDLLTGPDDASESADDAVAAEELSSEIAVNVLLPSVLT